MSPEQQNYLQKRLSLLVGWSNMSLRNRIALYYTVATAFLILLVFTAIYFTVDRVVYKHFDDELSKEVSETLSYANMTAHDFKGFSQFLESDINDNHNEDTQDDQDEGKHSHNDKKEKKADVDPEFIQIVNSSGEVIIKSANLNLNTLVLEPGRRGTSYFNSHVDNSPVRQVQVSLLSRDGLTRGYLLVAVPVKSAIIVLRDLQEIFFISFPLIILTLFVLTRLIAGRSIRPIEKVIATAEKMSQTNLDQRIPLPYHHDELYRLSATMNALLDRIQDAFQREKHFTADASHELKTPIAVVKGTLEVLVRRPRDRDHYESKIQFCLKELSRMAHMIDQLLMLARYESSKIKPHIQTVALPQHIDDLVERMLPSALAKGISIAAHHTENARIAADPGMLDMMFENILSNAIKYSPSGSSIAIVAECTATAVVCSISDQGIGIPEEKRSAVFERFYRVDESRNSNTGGLGLGLSIVKKLADLQQIKVSVTSATNSGTTFTLTCPHAGESCVMAEPN